MEYRSLTKHARSTGMNGAGAYAMIYLRFN